ncbi:tape measure protein [Haemophilus haemolyticus]|uniref:Tape measure protein n=1 Tax=Haemophilus haemolyticus TaxID=726 RepID=A0A852PMK9_HAEHA|nr:tape measure protein [Haemophilus haemolyticus]NYA27574.1 tape measure protein [Haemophilus haemolyticus]
MASSGNSTSFYINLAGNISQQAARFGRDVSQFATQSGAKLTALSARIKATGVHFKTLGAGIGAVSNKINSMGNMTIPILGVGAAAGAATVGKSMLRTAADFEMAGIRMKQTFGDQGDAANKWLQKFATDTPMAFADTQQAMMRLKTAGIDPMNGSLQALVDYNAKVGGDAENLNGYISAISKGFIKGKLSMEEINPLLERNVKVFDLLAQETGGKYTADQMQKMLQEGKLGRKAIAALLRAMGRDAKGAAKEQMKTWDGLVSNLEDTWTSMQARFMEHGAFDTLKKEMGSFVDWLNEKIDDGTLDEFAKTVSDVLVKALQELKSAATEIKPILENIGSVMSWIAEKAGGYGNIAKFAAALYGANKLARISLSAGQSVYGFGKGVAGVSKATWGIGKALFGRGKKGSLPNPADSVASAIGQTAGVQSVYVVNMPTDFGGVGGDFSGKRKRGKKVRSKSNGKYRPNDLNHKPAKAVKPTGAPKALPTVATSGGANVANGVKQATQSLKTTATNVSKSTANLAKSATSVVSKTVSKAVPLLNTGLAMAQGAAVLLDEDSTAREKSESIGSIAGSTAGAIIGQALIPIPVVGAAIGGFLGEYVGSWLGDKVGEQFEEKPKTAEAPAQQISAAVANVGQSVGNFVGSEIGEKLAGINPIDTKLNGQIEVNVKPTEGLIASVSQANIKTNQSQDKLGLKVSMGYSGQALYGGA